MYPITRHGNPGSSVAAEQAVLWSARALTRVCQSCPQPICQLGDRPKSTADRYVLHTQNVKVNGASTVRSSVAACWTCRDVNTRVSPVNPRNRAWTPCAQGMHSLAPLCVLAHEHNQSSIPITVTPPCQALGGATRQCRRRPHDGGHCHGQIQWPSSVRQIEAEDQGTQPAPFPDGTAWVDHHPFDVALPRRHHLTISP